MKKTICYYITGFGFGHLTRSLAIIERLLAERDDVRIIIKADPRLLDKAQLHLHKYAGRYSLHAFISHFSIIFDPITLYVDLKATGQDALRWINSLPASVERECVFLREHKVELVLSDIVPEAFGAAVETGIPAVGISNFTWYEICADVLGRATELQPLRHMYRQASAMLVYPFSTGSLMPMDNRVEVGPIARPFDTTKIGHIRRRYKKEARPLAFLSVGGVATIEDFPLREDMDYLVTRGIKIRQRPNVHRLDEAVPDSHNYLAACDVVITKCGWSTVAEAALARVPMWLLLSKNGWLEERCVHREVAALGIGRAWSFDDLERMTLTEINSELHSLRKASAKLPKRYNDGMSQIIGLILRYLP